MVTQAADAEPAAGKYAPATTQALFVSNDGTFKRYRIPSLIVTKKGTTLAICEGRVDGGGLTGNIDLVLRRSFDSGQTWKALQTIADLGDDTLGNPCPVVDRDTGTIWLAFTLSPGKFTETQIVAGQSSGPTTVWITRSEDDGATWSEPRDISPTARRDGWGWYGTGPGIGIQLQSGRLLVPRHLEFLQRAVKLLGWQRPKRLTCQANSHVSRSPRARNGTA
jgi:sialidase-1